MYIMPSAGVLCQARPDHYVASAKKELEKVFCGVEVNNAACVCGRCCGRRLFMQLRAESPPEQQVGACWPTQ